jgi:hypothetical protein
MFKKDFVVVIKCDGKILREIDDIVSLPFGSEYSILIKNLNSRKAQVCISIDGKDILDNKKLIIHGNKELELEGYLKGFNARNKFKFIQKTKEISDYRGDRIDDGIIRVEYQFEKKIVTQRINTEYSSSCTYTYGTPLIYKQNNDFFDSDMHIYNSTSNTCLNIKNNENGSIQNSSNSLSFSNRSMRNFCDTSRDVSLPLDDEGITVHGSTCNQKFREAYIGELEETSSVITLKLRGYNRKNIPIGKPITVKTKIRCETCGKYSRSNSKFCDRCGTCLI